MKGLRRVIVADAFVTQALTQGHRIERPLSIVEGIPRGAVLVAVEHPAVEFGVPRVGSTAFVFEHESWDVTQDGEVPTLTVRVVETAH